MSKNRFTETSWRDNPWFRALCGALLACKSEGEMADFLRDVATLSELHALSERLEVARQLAQGLPYRQVASNTGASTATVTRVASFLADQSKGYGRVISKLPRTRLSARRKSR